MDNCIFCDFNNSELIEESSLCYARRDGYPVSDHHTLVIPKRHVESYFDLEESELIEIYQNAATHARRDFRRWDPTVSAFNVGVNIGRDAGQSIFHVHMHLIPRRQGDIDNPQGGVRGVIPSKRTYIKRSKE